MTQLNWSPVNPGRFNYLAERREKKEVCEGCPHSCFCGGFYNLDDVPEPEWLVTPESLVREVESEMQVR